MAGQLDDPAFADLLSKRLKAKGADAVSRLRRARKRLPYRLRVDADHLIAAEELAQKRPDLPPLNVMRTEKAKRRLSGHIDRRDVAAERRRSILDWFALLVLNLALFGLLLAGFWYLGQG